MCSSDLEEQDICTQVVTGIQNRYKPNKDIEGIIFDELESFYSGILSAEDVANNIQDRVTTYFEEHK